MSVEYLEPARSIIEKIGIEKVAEVTGRHVSRVYRWRLSRERGGTGGFIPPTEARQLLLYARTQAIDLTADDFFNLPRVESNGKVTEAAE
jgi:hypothetical protein